MARIINKNIRIRAHVLWSASLFMILPFPLAWLHNLITPGQQELWFPLFGDISSNKLLENGSILGYADWNTAFYTIFEYLSQLSISIALLILVYKYKITRYIALTLVLLSNFKLVEALDIYQEWGYNIIWSIAGIIAAVVFAIIYILFFLPSNAKSVLLAQNEYLDKKIDNLQGEKLSAISSSLARITNTIKIADIHKNTEMILDRILEDVEKSERKIQETVNMLKK